MSKKLVSLLLAVLLVLAMAVPAFAATGDPGSIKIVDTVPGKTYEMFRIFDLTGSNPDATTGKFANVSYTIDPAWAGFFDPGDASATPAVPAGPGAGYISDTNSGSLSPISIGGATKYINLTESNVAAFADAALEYAGKNNLTPTATATGAGGTATETTVSELPLGYYLVYPDGATDVKTADGWASICSLTSTVPDAEIKVKATCPEIEKSIETTDTNGNPVDVDHTNGSIGDVIDFKLESKVPDMTGYETYLFTFNDNMTAGLQLAKADTSTGTTTYVAATDDTAFTVGSDGTITTTKENGAFTITVGTDTLVEGKDYRVYLTTETDGSTTIKIVFVDMVGKYKDKTPSRIGDAIVVKYKAIIDDDALVMDESNPNKAKIKFSNKPFTDPDPSEIPPDGNKDEFDPDNYPSYPKGESPESQTDTYSASLTLQKVDENGNTLTGAKFKLTGDNLNRVKTTTASTFVLDATGEYYKLVGDPATYTKEAPHGDEMRKAANGSYVVFPGGSLPTGMTLADCKVLNGTTYRPLTDAEKASGVSEDRYNLYLDNSSAYASTTDKYKKTTTTTMQGEGTSLDAEASVDASGAVSFDGLSEGTYTITETETPSGYNTIDPFTVTITFDETEYQKDKAAGEIPEGKNYFVATDANGNKIDMASFEIMNQSGTVLPETGGMGTTIFYVLGSVLLVGAAVLLITRKRMSVNG